MIRLDTQLLLTTWQRQVRCHIFFQHLSREISDNSIGTGVSTGGVGAPAGGIVPTVAPAGGVGVDGDEDDVARAESPAELVR